MTLMLIMVTRRILRRPELHQQVYGVSLASDTMPHWKRIEQHKQDAQHRLSKRVPKETDEVSLPSVLSRILYHPAMWIFSVESCINLKWSRQCQLDGSNLWDKQSYVPPFSLPHTHTPPHWDFTKRPTQYNLPAHNNFLQGGRWTARPPLHIHF